MNLHIRGDQRNELCLYLSCIDEVGKLPWVLHHFRKYKWVKDLTHLEWKQFRIIKKQKGR